MWRHACGCGCVGVYVCWYMCVLVCGCVGMYVCWYMCVLACACVCVVARKAMLVYKVAAIFYESRVCVGHFLK